MQLRNFKWIFQTEKKTLLTKLNLFVIPVIVIIFVFVYIIQTGIGNYNSILKSNESFKSSEMAKLNNQNSVTMYGALGEQIMISPSPTIIFNSGIQNLKALFDSGSRFYVFQSQKGKIPKNKLDSLFIIFSLCLLSLIYGYKINREYITYLVPLVGFENTFLLTSFAKLLILFCLTSFIFFITIIQLAINSIVIFNMYFFITFLEIFGLLVFFLVLGLFIAYLRVKKNIKLGLIFIACLILFLIPFIIGEFIADESGDEYKIEEQNWKEMFNFETRLKKEFGPSKVEKKGDINIGKIFKAIESGQKIEYQKMRDNENKIIEDQTRCIKKYHLINSLFPTSFFKSTLLERSSFGLKGLIDFEKYAANKKDEFVQFYIDQKFRKALKGQKVKFSPFRFKKIFKAKPQLPFYYFIGIISQFLYIIILFLLAYYNFKWGVVEIDEKKYKGFSVYLFRKKRNYLLTKDEMLIDYVIQSIFFGSPLITVDFECAGAVYLPPLKDLLPGAERFLGVDFKDKTSNWESILKKALSQKRVVITRWKLDEFDEDMLTKYYQIIKNSKGVNINIGDDQIEYILCDNPIRWEFDKSIMQFNPNYLVARLLSSNACN